MPIFNRTKLKCRVIVIEESILNSIRVNLEKLMELWRKEGAEKIVVFKQPKGVCNSSFIIRGFLRKMSRRYNLEGILIIGELPVAFFEETYASRNLLYTSDYFFMELNGLWNLGEGNKVTTTQKRQPTICAGRVFIGSDTGISADRPPVTEYYNRFLRKIIDFRIQGSAYRHGGNAAVVSNLGGVEVYRNHLSQLYPSAAITAYDGVTNTEYKNIVETGYDWILYYGHSDPGQHSMANGTIWNPFNYLEANMNTNIFQFESCGVGTIAWHSPSDPYDPSSALVVNAMSDPFISNILGNDKGGVLVLAPSIPGYFENMEQFYNYLRQGTTFGEAFRLWMAKVIADDHPHYMSLYGDPFLHFRPINPSIYRRKRSWWQRLLDFFYGRGIEYV